MSNREISAPAPEVQHLPTLFRRIESGELRIPAFQRKFVWTEAQVLKLLESVYKSYPIGSVLLWRVDAKLLQVSQDPHLPFPHVEERYPLSFILDGMQRLSTLYGVIYWSRPEEENVFNVVFDLHEQVFRHYSAANLPGTYLPLSVLSSPRRLLDAQRYLASLPDGDVLIDRSIELQARFQEYLVPTVAIARREVGQVVEIFERINNTGTKLSTVDFMRALTWSDEFDLNERIASIHRYARKLGFDWRTETLVKVMAVVLGIQPSPHEMLALRNRTARELNAAAQRSRSVIRRIARFLRERFGILSADFVPYEGQILVLARVFSMDANPSQAVLVELERWFWSISFSEGLRGKPDHYVARFLTSAEWLVEGEVESMEHRMDVGPEQFLERRFIKGAALSAAVVSMLARNQARSLFSGEIIPPEYYMREFGSENFAPLLSIRDVRHAVGKRLPSARVFANIILLTEQERREASHMPPEAILARVHQRLGSDAEAVLESQLLPASSRAMLEARDFQAFLSARADLLYSAANVLTAP